MQVDPVAESAETPICVRCGAWARVGSKYCSHACGIAVHLERIAVEKEKEMEQMRKALYDRRSAVLWQEIEQSIERQEYHSCAEELDAQLLVEVKRDRESELEVLAALKLQQDELEKEIEIHQTKNVLLEDQEPEEHTVGRTSHFDCPYCGVAPTTGVSLAQHLPSCFQKFEAANLVTGNAATPEGDVTSLIYCDRFEAKTGKYCKQLKASCCLHSGVVPPRPAPGTRAKVDLRELCGAPTKDAKNGRCSLLRLKCPRHFNWENFARKQLELQIISHTQLAEALRQEVDVIKEKMILARLCRGLKGSASTIPAQGLDAS